MNVSEMTNEVLAKNAEEFANAFHNESDKAILREAAARLRNVTVRSDNSAVIAELQRRLKVSEDALAKLQDRFVSSVHDGTIDPYEALKIAEDALAAIREQGGGKPIRNCDRFETAEDAYNACPQFCDIEVKQMTDRELKIVEATLKGLEWLFAPTEEEGAK